MNLVLQSTYLFHQCHEDPTPTPLHVRSMNHLLFSRSERENILVESPLRTQFLIPRLLAGNIPQSLLRKKGKGVIFRKKKKKKLKVVI